MTINLALLDIENDLCTLDAQFANGDVDVDEYIHVSIMLDERKAYQLNNEVYAITR